MAPAGAPVVGSATMSNVFVQVLENDAHGVPQFPHLPSGFLADYGGPVPPRFTLDHLEVLDFPYPSHGSLRVPYVVLG